MIRFEKVCLSATSLRSSHIAKPYLFFLCPSHSSDQWGILIDLSGLHACFFSLSLSSSSILLIRCCRGESIDYTKCCVFCRLCYDSKLAAASSKVSDLFVQTFWGANHCPWLCRTLLKQLNGTARQRRRCGLPMFLERLPQNLCSCRHNVVQRTTFPRFAAC